MKKLLAIASLIIAEACGSSDPSLVPHAPKLSLDDGEVELTIPSDTELRGRCEDGWACVWWDAEQKGDRLRYKDHGKCQNLDDKGFSDEVSSWHNRTNVTTCLYWDRDCKGKTPIKLGPGERADHMGSWNDEASSIRVGCR